MSRSRQSGHPAAHEPPPHSPSSSSLCRTDRLRYLWEYRFDHVCFELVELLADLHLGTLALRKRHLRGNSQCEPHPVNRIEQLGATGIVAFRKGTGGDLEQRVDSPLEALLTDSVHRIQSICSPTRLVFVALLRRPPDDALRSVGQRLADLLVREHLLQDHDRTRGELGLRHDLLCHHHIQSSTYTSCYEVIRTSGYRIAAATA